MIDAPPPRLRPEEVIVDIKAVSLNRRDILLIKGLYNPNIKLPAITVSDAAGVVPPLAMALYDYQLEIEFLVHAVVG
ncbi:MAG: alcohol dehydrogenase catalytic domain-containing protein [Candidatus Anammoxibacter sp.]